MPVRASIATLVTTIAVALGAFGLAVAAPLGPHAAELRLQAAGGAVDITSSRDGQTLFAAGGMRPGVPVSGTLTLTNSGGKDALLALRASSVTDTPGPGLGVLSSRLVVSVTDVTGGHAPVTLWTGLPAALTDVALGTLRKGQARDLVVTATLPSGANDNAYQGAGTSLGLLWEVKAVPDAAATPKPTTKTKTPPVTRPMPTPAPTPSPATPTIVRVPANVLGLPSTKRCVSRKRFRLTVRAPRGVKVSKVVVRVNRKLRKRASARSGKAKLKLTLSRLPRGKLRVAVQVRGSDGRTYAASRTYRACR